MEFIEKKERGDWNEREERGRGEREAETLPQRGGRDWKWIELVY